MKLKLNFKPDEKIGQHNYPKKLLLNSLDEFLKKDIPAIQISLNKDCFPKIDPSDIGGELKAYVLLDDGTIDLYFVLLNTPAGEIMKNYIAKTLYNYDLYLTTAGLGKVDPYMNVDYSGFNISEFKIIYLHLTQEKEF